ncbi:hypothetical protein F4781DRAFT_415785 [Annulohypoxylon bovei var. microspora]|nr:hypothetical protein F4781DRAFT_415785 [Annulohypoxylon bovei var. microspora]
MSGDQQTPSFGDPNAQPPTPKQTPTSAAFPSSVFETPKNNRASFDESSGWTPQFAEEYSVFNATPGNLKGSSHPHFVDYSVATSFQSSNHKRPLSTDSIAAEIATHVTHFSPNPDLLPPVDPSRRVPSSPNPLVTGQNPTEAGFRNSSQQLSKKVCRDAAQEVQVQTATPPPSTHKGQRRLAPKLQTGTMQNDGYEQEFIAGTPQQQHMPNFISTTPTDMFGYPMSAPATAPSFGDSRMFWDTDMGGMDLDFSTTSANVFQTSGHRPMSSQDWGKSNEIFQETGATPPQSQDNNQPAKKERALAPKPPPPSLDTNVADSSMFSSSFTTSADDSFAMMSHGGGVDPGLLFTRPPSSSMESAPFNPMSQPPLMQSFSQPEPVTLVAKPPKRGTVRRSASTKEMKTGKKASRVSASSPIKPSDRPGLSRSFSEKITRKPVGKASNLPNLAPATRPVPQNTGRSVSQGSRPSGRISPLKNQPHRLPSLSSIPETPAPRTQTSVKFTIDSKGRARAETTTVVLDDDDTTPTVVRRRKEQRGKGKSWASSEDDESSTDDEPIIIPSRNTSFSLPQPRRPSTHSYHSSQRSVSDQSTSSLGIYYNEPNPIDRGAESEAETVMNMSGSGNLGDAASELRKVMESRQKRTSNPNGSFTSRAAYSNSSTVTPASSKTSDLHTPSTDRGHQIRCVCNTNSSHGNSYMVQCGSCDMWLHGKCVNITRQTLPKVYICAFCANTPNAHGMRGREVRRSTGGANPRVPATSPLAHKSFKSFR